MNDSKSLPTRFPSYALPVALLIGFLSILPYFGLHFEYIPGDLGDSRLCNYLLEHGYRWVTGQETGSFFDAPFYYPARMSIRYSDNFLGGLPFYLPLRLVGIDRETAFQIWIVIGYMLNYLAAAWVLHRLRFHWFAVLAGAFVFAYSQAALTHSWHIQLHYRFAIPLAWYFLHLFLEHFSPKHLLASLGFLAWQYYCSIYEGYFLALFLGAFVLVKIFTKPIVRNYFRSATVRNVAAEVLIVLGFLVAIGVLAKGYARSVYDPRLMAARRPEVISMLPRPVSYFVGFTGSSEVGWLYDRFTLPMKHEHIMFVGLIPWIAVLALVLSAKRPGRHPETIPALVAMFVVMAITLYLNGYSFYFLLMKLPGVNGIRGVSRIILILLLPFAIATAQVLHLCRERLQRAQAASVVAFFVVVAAGLVMENRTTPYRFKKEEGGERVQKLVRQLPSELPRDAVLASIYPLGTDGRLDEIDAMLAAQDKSITTMNGYSGEAPDGFRYLHSCGDVKLALLDIEMRNPSFPLENSAQKVVTVGSPIDAPCTTYLSHEASTAVEPLPEDAFRANIEVTAPSAVTANSEFMAQVHITNQSSVPWHVRGLPSGKFALRVSCQWLAAGAQDALAGYPNRFDLPYDLKPNESASMAVLLISPAGQGAYTIECDAVQELIHWFHSMGSPTGKTTIQVRRDAATRAIQAFLDVVDANIIGGWAWDQDRPDAALQIEIRDGDTHLATVPANVFRPDLRDAGFGTGKYSFSIPNPFRTPDGKTHTIHVLVSGTNIELTGSPKMYPPPGQ